MYTISRYVDIGLDKINYCKGNRADGNRVQLDKERSWHYMLIERIECENFTIIFNNQTSVYCTKW